MKHVALLLLALCAGCATMPQSRPAELRVGIITDGAHSDEAIRESIRAVSKDTGIDLIVVAWVHKDIAYFSMSRCFWEIEDAISEKEWDVAIGFRGWLFGDYLMTFLIGPILGANAGNLIMMKTTSPRTLKHEIGHALAQRREITPPAATARRMPP
jgi:hypothetical protein